MNTPDDLNPRDRVKLTGPDGDTLDEFVPEALESIAGELEAAVRHINNALAELGAPTITTEEKNHGSE